MEKSEIYDLFDEESTAEFIDEIENYEYMNEEGDSENSQEDELETEDYGIGSETEDFGNIKDDYKLNSISDIFLKTELSIKVESCRTKIKFGYRGVKYSGIVIHKINKDDYIFNVREQGKHNEFLKKIHIPDASLL